MATSAILAALLALTVAAQPDFTQSEITADPKVPLEGDVVTFTARVVLSVPSSIVVGGPYCRL